MTIEVKRSQDVKELVKEELNRISNLPLKVALTEFIIEPFLQMRKWDYSLTGELLPCWIVANLRQHDMGLAYSQFGHGNRGDHWGIVQRSDRLFQRDDSWFLRLEDAFINSGFWDGPIPDDYEIP